ncbi:MAG: cbb3-type cytochrome c oxidase subunit 3 [Amaricoccus sp.]
METYGILRTLADSWGLVLIVVAFLAVLAWVFRPGGRKSQDAAARSIFKNEDSPKNEDDRNGR